MKLNRWWLSRPGERYWLEITDRENLSADLNAPQTKDNGQEFWGYSLIKEVQPGNTVFHYWTPRRGIVGYSRAVGEHWEDQVTWAAHGTSARDAGVSPYTRPGWRLGLEGYTELSRPVTLEMLREDEARIRDVRAQLQREVAGGLYLPFELSGKRPLRMMQGYLAKFPAALISMIPELATAPVAESSPSSPDARSGLGVEYRPASVDRARRTRSTRSRGHSECAGRLRTTARLRSPFPPAERTEFRCSVGARRLHVRCGGQEPHQCQRREAAQARVGTGSALQELAG